MNTKITCIKCNNDKLPNEFVKVKSKIYHQCIKCKNEYTKKYKEDIKLEKRHKLNNTIVNNTKKCNKCNETKNILEFKKRNDTEQGYRNECKNCSQIKMSEYYHDKYNEVRRNKKKTDLNIRLIANHRNYLYKCVKKNKMIKENKSIEYLGCSIEFLKEWLEYQFKDNMSWNNYGTYWTIDHVLPLSLFNFKESKNKQIAFCWTNLQPLVDNFSKSNKIRISDYYNVSINAMKFMLIKSKYNGYQNIDLSLCWLREKLRYGKNSTDNNG